MQNGKITSQKNVGFVHTMASDLEKRQNPLATVVTFNIQGYKCISSCCLKHSGMLYECPLNSDFSKSAVFFYPVSCSFYAILLKCYKFGSGIAMGSCSKSNSWIMRYVVGSLDSRPAVHCLRMRRLPQESWGSRYLSKLVSILW